MKKKKDTNLSFFETTGFSMWPFLRAGEKLIIKRTPLKNLKIGDIIIYRANSQIVCHRLIKRIKEKEGYRLYARGDSSVSQPEPVSEEMFLGAGISIIKNGKIIRLNALKQRLINRFIVLFAPLISRGARIIRPGYSRIKTLLR